MRRLFIALFVFQLSFVLTLNAQSKIVVFQSDFGVKDGAVSAMKGVAMGVSTELKLYDLTHEIPAYDIWEGAYRLMQTVPYWPEGTVFVSVVDPGVGTSRKSVVAKTKAGQYIVTPDNGTLTLVAEYLGIIELREIDEAVNRRKNSEKSYTFHGRDVYAFTGARLAAGVISYEQVGKALPGEPVMISYQKAVLSGNVIKGNIPVLDIQYGNVWTNIGTDLFNQWKLKPGNKLQVTIYNKSQKVYEGTMPYVETFGAVAKGKPLAYFNSLLQLSFALNMQNFAKVYHVNSGSDWSVQIKKVN
jgi:S-adenosylmethionine hydrolase